jgi:hypothetical protein
MNKDEVERKLSKVNQIMDELIYDFMQTEMSYEQAEEEVFRMLKRKRLSEESKSSRTTFLFFSFPWCPLFSTHQTKHQTLLPLYTVL